MERLRKLLSALNRRPNKELTAEEKKLVEYILEACPDIRAKFGIDQLREEVSRNRGEYAGRLTQLQIERLCSLKRDLAMCEDSNDI